MGSHQYLKSFKSGSSNSNITTSPSLRTIGSRARAQSGALADYFHRYS